MNNQQALCKFPKVKNVISALTAGTGTNDNESKSENERSVVKPQ